MKLIAFEIRKLFRSKTTILTMLIILFITNIPQFLDAVEWRKQIGNVNGYVKLVESHEGEIDRELATKIDDELNKMYKFKQLKGSVDTKDIKNINSQLNYKDKLNLAFKTSYSNAAEKSRNWVDLKTEDPEEPISLLGLENLYNTLELKGEKNSFKYKDTLKRINMLKSIGKPGYYNTVGWSKLTGFVTSIPGVIFISIVIVLVVAPIFSNECENGMERIILSTKMGRNKIVFSKIIASLFFVVVWITLFYMISFFIHLIPYNNLNNFNMKLNNVGGYAHTPYNWTIIQGFKISYLTAILSACTLSAVFCLISALSKNNIISMIVAFIFSIAPMFILGNGIISKILNTFPSITMSGNVLFQNYRSYNILNIPVLYPIAAVISLIILFILSVFLTFKVYNRKIRN